MTQKCLVQEPLQRPVSHDAASTFADLKKENFKDSDVSKENTRVSVTVLVCARTSVFAETTVEHFIEESNRVVQREKRRLERCLEGTCPVIGFGPTKRDRL